MEAQALDLLLRWLHFFAGIVWIGHNYTTLVQRPSYQPLVAADLTDASSPRFMMLLAREHGIFRWASVVTWGTGVLMLWQRGWIADAMTLTGYHAVIGLGMWIGTVMMLNVWLVLWPHQKKVLGFVAAPVEERLRASRVTFLSARVNTMLSIPLLFFMASAQHGGFLYG
ncbi:MAG TPA: urate hydroxylase PuuD [Burkholderiales bacterium]|nr:urate hydroxylase PuuD [Burkholderiales bacterium]